MISGACKQCGNPVLSPRRLYCSIACCRKAHRRRKLDESRELSLSLVRRQGLVRKRRTCLCCGKDFMSDGPWNRQCPKCANSQDQKPTVREVRGARLVNHKQHGI